MHQSDFRKRQPVKWMTVTALLMAMTVALSSFSIPVPGGHLYLCDVVICTAAILLDPLGAFIAGGIGSFLGDFFFYPAPMFVSLASHGLQAVIISLLVRRAKPEHRFRYALLGVLLGGTVMVIGYTLGRAFLYSTPEYAILKLPFEILQAAIGAAAALVLCFQSGLLPFWDRFTRR